MNRLLKKMRRALQLLYNFIFTNKTRILTIRVILLSAWFRTQIRFIQMAKLQKSFGEQGRESPHEEIRENLRYAYLVGTRVERVCGKTLWDSKCMVRALIAQRLLARRGIHTTMYLGVRTEDGEMHAHAWLRCGPLFVTGGNGSGHTVVSMFYR